MANGGDVSKPCREMIDMSRYTFLYVSIRLYSFCVYLKRATPIYAQGKSWLDEHGMEVE